MMGIRSSERSSATLVVRKFGGACFASLDGYRQVAELVAAAVERQVIVVSARKGVTDELLGLVRSVGPSESPYADHLVATGEMQSAALLLLALHRRGVAAELVPAEAVFETDGVPGAAAVTTVHGDRILAVLERGAIPVVPGFYGAGTAGRIVTFKRGGSDFSAVALGVALRASWVELCKAEVDGIFDKDPNVDPTAKPFCALSHQHAVDIARAGGKVLQADSAELALKWNLPLLVRPAFKRGGGTWVGQAVDGLVGERAARFDG
jgi:aspartate kinase